jgi:molecular chaperone GrpE
MGTVRKTLKQQLSAINEELAQCKDNHLRALAELENYRKRIRKEKEELVGFANERLITDLLPVLDDFERGLNSFRDTKSKAVKDFCQGVEFIHKNLKAVLEREGLTSFSGQGKEFDPRLHEALAVEETDEVPPNHVVSELSCGYRLGEKVICPAKVVVSASLGSKKKEEDKPECQNPNVK